MGTVKRTISEMNEEARSAAGGFLLETVGGKGSGAHFEPSNPKAFEEDREKLSKALGRDHFVAEKDVEGKLVGKVELGGNVWGRIDQGQEGFALVPWNDSLTELIGKDVSMNREAGETVAKSVEDSISLER